MKPKVAFFEFTSCEGCQLEALNLDSGELLDLINAVDIVNFREVMTGGSDDYDIAFIEGSISRDAEVPRLQKIRKQARVVVAMGACACTGGVNCLKNHVPTDESLRTVYGEAARHYSTMSVRPINKVVNVDYYMRGCPPTSTEFLRIVTALLLNKQPYTPNYPVCVECKMAGNVCVFDRGMSCIGPVTRAGCDAICVNSGGICWGCRGLVDEPNIDSEKSILKKYGLTVDQVIEKFKIFDTYAEVSN